MTDTRPTGYPPQTRGRTCDDGSSRAFDDTSNDPRMVVASVLARRDGWAEIRPAHWADAGAIVKALKAAGQLVDRRHKAEKATAGR